VTKPWHKNQVIYGLAVDSFQDSNGDGLGDFQGLISRLDYLEDLGITCIWVLPFFPSPNLDNGYDIADYENVDPGRGNLEDFRQFVDEAHRRDIRVLIDLVAHHTSSRHPWFQSALANEQSPYRDYYVWSESVPDGAQPENIFPTVEDGVWQYADAAGKYYFHLFYSHEPDLYFANPRVQEEILRVAEFWMSCGIDGFRIDATNHLFEEKGIPGTGIDQPCDFLGRLHDVVTRHNPQAILMAEADTEPGKVEQFVCGGSGVPLYFNFLFNNYLYLALARESAKPIQELFTQQPADPGSWVWVNFLRNLDEVDLERISESEREEVYHAFAPEEEMRVYGRGIRRRLAPMLGGDTGRLKMVFSLLLSLPGSPLFVYGDETGMGDDLRLPERESVRLPMQWSACPYGGFSTSPHHSDINAAIAGGQFGYERVNVEDQQKDSESLLQFVKLAIRRRTSMAHFREGKGETLAAANDHVLAFGYQHEQGRLLALHNFSNHSQDISPAIEPATDAEVLLSDTLFRIDENHRYCLGPYGYAWLLVR
jgi:maltose alpha-D-glucosyltransferase/alpha-amylase